MTELAQQIQHALTGRRQTLATAESCTGGRVAAALTAVPGSSAYFEGGIVAYQNEVKTRFLGVSAETILRHGVVSRQVVEQMVAGCCRMFHTDWAIATSGCAGPDGGSEAVPVGTIWIAVGSEQRQLTTCLHGDHGRIPNVEAATQEALRLLLELLQSGD